MAKIISEINKEKKEQEQKINEPEKELKNKDMLISDLKSKQNNINNELRHAINIIKKRDIKFKKNSKSEESDFDESEE